MLRKYLITVAVFLVLIQIGAVDATEVHRTKITLEDNGDARVMNLFSINSINRSSFFVPLENPLSVSVYDTYGDLGYSQSNQDIIVSLRDRSERYSFTVDYITNSLTSKNGSQWILTYNYYKLGDFDDTGLTVVLPEGASLISNNNQGTVFLENGKINIYYGLGSDTMTETIEFVYTLTPVVPPEEPPNYSFVILPFVAIIIIITIYLLSRRKPTDQIIREQLKQERKQEKSKDKLPIFSKEQEDILKTVSDTEERIVKELIKHKEGMSQKKLALELGLPKSTMSRNLKKLQIKTLVDIKEHGMTKKIKLSQWFLEKS